MDLPNSLPTADPHYVLIETSAAFQKLLTALRSAERFAIDIEGDSLYHYFEKVCLIQISTDSSTFILDPLALQDLDGFSQVTAEAGVEKVLHAAAYDVSCLRRDYKCSFANVFDTHLAAQLMGYGQLGLSALLQAHLGVVHSKRRQRDDWSRRPLKREQLNYAAMDTHHLLELRDVLEEQLREKGRLSWAREEFDCIAEMEFPEKDFDPQGFRRIRGYRDLSPQQQLVLRSLFLLRDRYAREMDSPPFKVMNDFVLVELARHPPISHHELSKRRGISRRLAHRFGQEICRTIEQAQKEDPRAIHLAPRPPGKSISKEARELVEKLKKWRQTKSEELELSVGVTFPGNLLETIASSPPADYDALANIRGMRRWRIQEFGQEVLEVIGKV
jgi:ribonuclease D